MYNIYILSIVAICTVVHTILVRPINLLNSQITLPYYYHVIILSYYYYIINICVLSTKI